MVIPVVVEMSVASVIDRAIRAAVEVETAMRPRRDTGETFLKIVDVRVSRWIAAVNPFYAYFLRQSHLMGSFDPNTALDQTIEVRFFT